MTWAASPHLTQRRGKPATWDLEARVLAQLEAGEQTSEQIADGLGEPVLAVRRRLALLRDEGRVTTTQRSKTWFWSLVA